MPQHKVLAIDLGASSGRGIVGSFDGEKLTLKEVHRFPNEPVYVNGSYQWDILRIFHEIKTAINKCALDEEDRNIKTIGIDTWGVDFGLLDEDGKLMENPYHYRDSRVDGMFDTAFRKMSKEDIYKRTGLQFMEFNTLFQLLSLAQQRPKVLGNAKSMLFIPDLLNYFLTGVKRTEYTIASTSQLLNPSARDWDMELAGIMGIPQELLGEIVQPGGEVGPLLKQIKDEIGDIDAMVVNAASHDTASAVVAVPSDTEDFVYISSGTWSLMGLEVNEPIVNSESYKFNVTNEGGAYGKIRVLKNIMGLWILQESRRQWEREGTKHSFNELEKMALEVKPCAYLINPDSPEFARPGNLPQKIREYCKASGQAVPQSKGEIVRCIYDSLALKYRQVVEALDSMKGSRTKQINIVGGGTKDTLLCQLAADACGREVLAGPVEATAIGNITVQLIGQGLIKDLSQARRIIRDSFDVIHYAPAGGTDWDKAYEFFVTLK